MCGLHRAQGDEEREFLGLASNQGLLFINGLASKPLGWVSWFDLKSKVDSLSVVWPQNHWDRFPGLGLKTGSYGLVIWASKSP
jgi:hypothetical protein